jgi:glycosyltransferase involved in cell wall biosynthesis
MRISFVITNGPSLTGGLERVCLRLAQHLGEGPAGNRIACRFSRSRQNLAGYFLHHEPRGTVLLGEVPVTTLSPAWARRQLLRPVLRLSCRPSTHGLARQLYEKALLPELIEASRGADLIHYLGSAGEMLGFAACRAAKELGLPFVVEPAVHPGQWGDSWGDRILYERADRVLAHSEHEAEVLVEMGVARDRVFAVTHGVDLGSGGDGNRFRSGHGIAGPMLLFLGRKTEAKGVTRCIDAFTRIRQRFPSATLVLVGPTEGKSVARLPDGVLDLDDVSEEMKQDALAACDLLCVPSEGESFGMVYFEAWAYHKPVVALDLPTLRETVGETGGGLLVGTDPADIAAAMGRLLESPELRQELGAAGKRAAVRHEWTMAARDYERLLTPLLR